jgi:indolepyruvate ferredoxin oxidoreductase beta subunit
MSFEALEALRYVRWLKSSGFLVYNAARINPSPVAAGMATYPADIDGRIAAAWPRVHRGDAAALALGAGTGKAANVVMLGALSPTLPFGTENWEAAIISAVPPKFVDVNLKAFRLGLEAASAVG